MLIISGKASKLGTYLYVRCNYTHLEEFAAEVIQTGAIPDDRYKRRDVRYYRFEGKKVLLVEDNLLKQEIAQAVLQDAGFTVDTADDGDVAVERLQDSKQGEFDLVLMDIQMPKMDGYAATRQIRTLPSDVANVPIVAMTANAFEEDKQKTIRAGMNAHIAKPIEAGRLMETLSHILT